MSDIQQVVDICSTENEIDQAEVESPTASKEINQIQSVITSLTELEKETNKTELVVAEDPAVKPREIPYLRFFKKAFKINEKLLKDNEGNPRNLQILIKNAKDIKEAMEGRTNPTTPPVEDLTIRIAGVKALSHDI